MQAKSITAKQLKERQHKGAHVCRETRHVEINGLDKLVDQIKELASNDGNSSIAEAIYKLAESLPKENDSPLLTEALSNLSIAIKKDHPAPQVTIEMPGRQPMAYSVIRDERGRAKTIVPITLDEVANEYR